MIGTIQKPVVGIRWEKSVPTIFRCNRPLSSLDNTGKESGTATGRRDLRHPVNKKLRFRKRNDVATGFKSSWNSVWREDYDEITTKEWLDAMYEDGVLQDVAFNVDIPVPDKEVRKKIVDLAARKLEENEDMDSLPDQCLSVCDWPKSCRFRSNCHGSAEPSWKFGFVPVDQVVAK